MHDINRSTKNNCNITSIWNNSVNAQRKQNSSGLKLDVF